MTDTYDAIVVGARCAGSPTAMLLARKGYRVLVVDRSTFPSDTVSTHFIHAPGVDALRRWGILDKIVATGLPPGRHLLVRLRTDHHLRHTTARRRAVRRPTPRAAPCSTRSSSTPPSRRAPRSAKDSPSMRS